MRFSKSSLAMSRVAKQFSASQNNFPRRKTIFRAIKQIPAPKNNLSRRKIISHAAKQFPAPQNNVPRRKTISRAAKQFSARQNNFPRRKTISRIWKAPSWDLPCSTARFSSWKNAKTAWKTQKRWKIDAPDLVWVPLLIGRYDMVSEKSHKAVTKNDENRVTSTQCRARGQG